MCLISVIVPIYRVENYIYECIESILNQSLTDFELILVDDCSDDNCPSICDMFKKKDSRVVVLHKTHGGLSDSRNAGLNLAKGRYIVFIDGDDYVHRDYLKRLYNNLIQNNSDVSVCDLAVFKTNKKMEILNDDYVLQEEKFLGIEAFNKAYNNKTTVYLIACSKMIKRIVLDNVRFKIVNANEDEFFANDIFTKDIVVSTVSEKLYYYRENPNGIMASLKKQFYLDAFYAFFERFRICKRHPLYKNNVLFINYTIDSISWSFKMAVTNNCWHKNTLLSLAKALFIIWVSFPISKKGLQARSNSFFHLLLNYRKGRKADN